MEYAHYMGVLSAGRHLSDLYSYWIGEHLESYIIYVPNFRLQTLTRRGAWRVRLYLSGASSNEHKDRGSYKSETIFHKGMSRVGVVDWDLLRSQLVYGCSGLRGSIREFCWFPMAACQLGIPSQVN